MAGYRKLGRTSSQRKALLRNQVTDLLYYGKIITTEAKAKEIRKIAEGIIALGIKSVFLVLGALGIAGMWEAVFGDVGVTIIAVLNAMRILKK